MLEGKNTDISHAFFSYLLVYWKAVLICSTQYYQWVIKGICDLCIRDNREIISNNLKNAIKSHPNHNT